MMMNEEKTMKLNLTVERIRSELFNGGFRPMEREDFYSYADADKGSLIAEIKVGRFEYQVLFSPELGNVQIFSYEDGAPIAWEMDLNTGDFINL
jgi:hypothetical protein